MFDPKINLYFNACYKRIIDVSFFAVNNALCHFHKL